MGFFYLWQFAFGRKSQKQLRFPLYLFVPKRMPHQSLLQTNQLLSLRGGTTWQSVCNIFNLKIHFVYFNTNHPSFYFIKAHFPLAKRRSRLLINMILKILILLKTSFTFLFKNKYLHKKHNHAIKKDQSCN